MELFSDEQLATERVAYVAGPMRHIPGFNFKNFDKWTAWLRAQDWLVHSPAEMDREYYPDIDWDNTTGEESDLVKEWTLGSALRRDFQAICNTNAMVMIPGWEKSAGVHAELPTSYRIENDIYLGVEDEDGNPLCLAKLTDEEILQAIEDGPEDHTISEERALTLNELRRTSGLPPYEFQEPVIGTGTLSTGEHRVVDPTTGGEKGQKIARFDLIPWEVMWELAEHYGGNAIEHGGKYPARNWQKGYRWTLSIGAILRHLVAWINGEDLDEETGHSHLVAVIWHACTLRWYQVHGVGTDDRNEMVESPSA